MVKGANKYLPKNVLLELADLKREHNINQDVVAFNKMVDYTRVGREMERIINLDFRFKPTRRRR